MDDISHLHMSDERGFHSEWSGVTPSPVAGRGGDGRERGDVTVHRMVEQVTPRIPHAVGRGLN